jgi:hypothetical protein
MCLLIVLRRGLDYSLEVLSMKCDMEEYIFV